MKPRLPEQHPESLDQHALAALRDIVARYRTASSGESEST